LPKENTETPGTQSLRQNTNKTGVQKRTIEITETSQGPKKHGFSKKEQICGPQNTGLPKREFVWESKRSLSPQGRSSKPPDPTLPEPWFRTVLFAEKEPHPLFASIGVFRAKRKYSVRLLIDFYRLVQPVIIPPHSPKTTPVAPKHTAACLLCALLNRDKSTEK